MVDWQAASNNVWVQTAGGNKHIKHRLLWWSTTTTCVWDIIWADERGGTRVSNGTVAFFACDQSVCQCDQEEIEGDRCVCTEGSTETDTTCDTTVVAISVWWQFEWREGTFVRLARIYIAVCQSESLCRWHHHLLLEQGGFVLCLCSVERVYEAFRGKAELAKVDRSDAWKLEGGGRDGGAV